MVRKSNLIFAYFFVIVCAQRHNDRTAQNCQLQMRSYRSSRELHFFDERLSVVQGNRQTDKLYNKFQRKFDEEEKALRNFSLSLVHMRTMGNNVDIQKEVYIRKLENSMIPFEEKAVQLGRQSRNLLQQRCWFCVKKFIALTITKAKEILTNLLYPTTTKLPETTTKYVSPLSESGGRTTTTDKGESTTPQPSKSPNNNLDVTIDDKPDETTDDKPDETTDDKPDETTDETPDGAPGDVDENNSGKILFRI